jgi:hypothetical protein
VPLILGLIGLIAFMFYESKVPRQPTVSWCTIYPLFPSLKFIAGKVSIALMSTRTGLSGYIQTFTVSIVLLGIICTASKFRNRCVLT